MPEQKRNIRCVDDDGREHTVIEIQEMVDATTISDQSRRYVPGLKRYQDSEDRYLEAVGDGVYKIVSTGQMLREIR